MRPHNTIKRKPTQITAFCASRFWPLCQLLTAKIVQIMLTFYKLFFLITNVILLLMRAAVYVFDMLLPMEV